LDRDGTSKSPDQQEEECRAEARQHGWQVTEVYSDRNVSAFKPGARRPAYERLLRDLEAGAFDVLLVWEPTRLTRGGLTGIAPVVELLQKAGAQLVSVTQPIDTTTTEGEMMLGFLAGMAKKESENTSKRVKRAHRNAVKDGKMHTGGNRQYG
jgi:site-specific DNA recombinase